MPATRKIQEQVVVDRAPFIKAVHEPTVLQTGLGALLPDIRQSQTTHGGVHHHFLFVHGQRTVYFHLNRFTILDERPVEQRAARERLAEANMIAKFMRRDGSDPVLKICG